MAGLFFPTLTLGVVGVFLYYVVAYLASPLKHIPGPLWAKFTNLWRFFDHYYATQPLTQRRLHEELGPAVRIGPNVVSLSDPSLLKTVYSTRGNFLKSDFYTVNDVVKDGHVIENVFGTRSNAFHGKYMRPIQRLYTMTSILTMESLVDRTIISLCEQLENRFISGKNAGKTCDIADWIGYYAWDVVGEITFSQQFDFLKSGTDVKNMIHTAESVMHYFGIVGQIPALDKLLGKSRYSPIRLPTFASAASFCAQRLIERLSNRDLEKVQGQKDFLDRFLEVKQQYPDIVGDNEAIGYLLLNMLAGADTTAITQKAIIYFVLRNPQVYQKLRDELDAANLSFPAAYEGAHKVSYLEAVIQEALRIHPPVGNVLERVVPHSGLTLPDGRTIAPGTIVGMNQWVVTRNKDIFGDDVDTFRPERWLRGGDESEVDYTSRLKRMKDADFSFGGGNRVCTGRHLAIVELFKVTSTLFSKYDMVLEDPNKEWTVHPCWFVFVDNIHVKLSPRFLGRPKRIS
ncbi:cytochrome P450 [Biscogniauxia marginata]|nr:cytochrome P450 [Biscogniauxia marginata]